MTALWMLLAIIGVCVLPMGIEIIFKHLGFKSKAINAKELEKSKFDSRAQQDARISIAAEKMKNDSYHSGGGPFG
ncbi:hypothetical protein [Halobacillus andaensis]|uniref:hypothetical protein n=1 Tax=Halobacillus andaensis TaxID=1176239 RepID=UPI003D709FC7